MSFTILLTNNIVKACVVMLMPPFVTIKHFKIYFPLKHYDIVTLLKYLSALPGFEQTPKFETETNRCVLFTLDVL